MVRYRTILLYGTVTVRCRYCTVRYHTVPYNVSLSKVRYRYGTVQYESPIRQTDDFIHNSRGLVLLLGAKRGRSHNAFLRGALRRELLYPYRAAPRRSMVWYRTGRRTVLVPNGINQPHLLYLY